MIQTRMIFCLSQVIWVVVHHVQVPHMGCWVSARGWAYDEPTYRTLLVCHATNDIRLIVDTLQGGGEAILQHVDEAVVSAIVGLDDLPHVHAAYCTSLTAIPR